MKIKELRKEKCLSQCELAELLSVQRSTVAKWETGRTFPRTEQLPKLARALNCTIDELFGEDPARDDQLDQEDPERVCGECMYISHGSVDYPRTCDWTTLCTCASQRACSNFEKRGEL